MIHTRDTSPRSFSSSTPVATLRASPAGLLGLVLALVVGAGRADNRCHVSVINQYNVALAMYSYDGGDGICAIPYGAYEVNGNGTVGVECFDDLACLIKLADSTDDGSGCGRTVTVPCGGELEFYYGPNGQEELSIYRRRNLMTGEALEAEATNEEEEDVVASSSSLGVGGDVVGAAFSSLGEVAQVTSSSLRGGAKGSKTGA